MFFGAVGLLAVLVIDTVAAAIVLDQSLVDSFYGAVKTLVTVDPNPAVSGGPDWFKIVISASMLIALLFAAAFTGGLVERLIGHRLTGLLGNRAVPHSDHVVVVGLGQVAGCGSRCCCAGADAPWSPSTTATTARTGATRRSSACLS